MYDSFTDDLEELSKNDKRDILIEYLNKFSLW